MKELLTKIINAWWYDKCITKSNYCDDVAFKEKLYKIDPLIQVKFLKNSISAYGEWIIINEIEL